LGSVSLALFLSLSVYGSLLSLRFFFPGNLCDSFLLPQLFGTPLSFRAPRRHSLYSSPTPTCSFSRARTGFHVLISICCRYFELAVVFCSSYLSHGFSFGVWLVHHIRPGHAEP
ncbi:unnamed protein product, partial [Ectocarpus sp. 13 AM-2016]